jgi:hypothetical protein
LSRPSAVSQKNSRNVPEAWRHMESGGNNA